MSYQLNIRQYKESDRTAWDEYVHRHPNGTLYHLSGWKNIIEKTYNHKTYFLIATSDTPIAHSLSPIALNVVGLLPLVHMKHLLFGNRLISMPFVDMGGILADNKETEQALLTEAINLAKTLKATEIELRHNEPLSWLANSSRLIAHNKDEAPSTQPSNLSSPVSYELSTISCETKSYKVRMLLNLPESSKTIWDSFKSKLRSQIKKPMKEGLASQIGGLELLDDFYGIFLVNMRDLGSPVHSKDIIESVLSEYAETAKIVLVRKENRPIAGSVVIGCGETLHNPWASSLREFARLSPNMLLYWTMLEYATDNGYKRFDFGRSTPDEGTYKYKEQWGASPHPLHWHHVSTNGTRPATQTSESSEAQKFGKAVQYWQKLPIPVTRILGPMIRKNIGL